MKNYKFLGILVVIFVLLGMPLGIMITKQYIYFSDISEKYEREFTLAEDFVVHAGFSVASDGYWYVLNDPVVLNEGRIGHICDEVNSVKGDEAGEEYINAKFDLDNGDYIEVCISTDIKSDNRLSVPVIDINSIESSQTILNEYKQSRERYHTKAKNMQIVGTAIVVVLLLAISAVVLLLGKKLRGNVKTYSSLIVFLLVIDIVMNAVLVFLLFPRRDRLKDGGTVTYESFWFGSIYSIEKLHEIYFDGYYNSFRVGTIITVFGEEIYNSAHVDYSNGYYAETMSSEEEEEMESLIASFLDG